LSLGVLPFTLQVDEVTPLVMRRAGQAHDALRSTVGVAAGLTVRARAGKRGGRIIDKSDAPSLSILG